MSVTTKKIARWSLYSLAIIIIILATIVSVGRLLTPYLTNHRYVVEQWASEQLHRPVTINQIYITWHYAPVLTLDQIQVMDPVNHQPVFTLRQVNVTLQIISSLLHRRPIPNNIKLTGADLVLREIAVNQWSIEGLKPLTTIDTSIKGDIHSNPIAQWVLSRPHILLDNIQVKYIPLHAEPRSITVDKLSLKNKESEHELSGKATLNQAMPLDIQFQLECTEKVIDFSTLKAKLYVYIQGLSLSQWLNKDSWHNIQLLDGIGSAKLWIDWDSGQATQVKSELQFYDVKLKSLLTQKIVNLSRISGKFNWLKEGDQQRLTGSDLLIDFPEHLWPTTGFSVTLNKGVLQAITLNYVDIADTIDLALASGWIQPEWQKKIISLEANGELRNLHVETIPLTIPLKVENDYLKNHRISTDFSGLSWASWQDFPMIQQLTGALTWDGRLGQLSLDSRQVSIKMDSLFPEEYMIDRLTGYVSAQRDQQENWFIKANKLKIKNHNINLLTDFNLILPKQASPTIDMKAGFSVIDTSVIEKYMPTKIMDPALVHWLKSAFYGGVITNGYAILKGKLSDFPFDQGNGQFTVGAQVSGLDFTFAPSWPDIKNTKGTLLFTGRKMIVDVTSGKMLDIDLNAIHAEIPYIGDDQPQILNLQSLITTDCPAALHYVEESPLQHLLGKKLAALQLTGSIKLDLRLSVPLKTPENTAVLGNMQVANADLLFPSWGIRLKKIAGNVQFTDKEINSPGLQANLFDKPINMMIQTVPSPNGNLVSVGFQSQINKAMLQDYLHLPSAALLDGETAYTVQLNLTSEKKSLPDQLIVATDLQGMAIHLPDVYGKKPTESKPLRVTINFDKQDKGLGIAATYADILSAAMTMQYRQSKTSFYSGEIHFGKAGQAVFQTKPGLLISGQFDEWDWDVWQGYIHSFMSLNKLNQTQLTNTAGLRGIDLEAKQLSALGLELHDASIQLTQDQSNWLINIKSNEIAGRVTVPMTMKNSINANFDYVRLMGVSNKNADINIKKIPAIHFNTNELGFNEIDFGGVELVMIPMSGGIQIQTLHAYSPYYNLNAKGQWRSTKSGDKTELQGNLLTKDVGKLLLQWGLKGSNIIESGGNADFNVSWNGSPYHPDLSTVLGDLNLTLTAGRIIDLSNSTDAKMGIGKMLNIFNVSSLPRRLTLNFRDFKNGYSFDSMKSHLTFKQGSIYTDKMQFDGPIAKIKMAGRIGYVAKDYDLNVSVTPYGVTSSLPIVATVVGGPIAGAATLVVDKVMGGAVSSAITHRYTVRGSWSRPEWVEQ